MSEFQSNTVVYYLNVILREIVSISLLTHYTMMVNMENIPAKHQHVGFEGMFGISYSQSLDVVLFSIILLIAFLI